jgi:hypothetical protein
MSTRFVKYRRRLCELDADLATLAAMPDASEHAFEATE